MTPEKFENPIPTSQSMLDARAIVGTAPILDDFYHFITILILGLLIDAKPLLIATH
jgi:hypothetical protein